MAKTPSGSGKPWTSADLRELKALAKENTPTRVIALKLARTEGAVYAKAKKEGLSLKPTNQSPYNRRGQK